jgi:pSer/pThr/pTyr-binding forkhead associated (FHA) protein
MADKAPNEKAPKRKDTDFLNLPPSEEIIGRTEPPVSPASAVTPQFTANSRLQLRIDNTKLTLAVEEKLVVGRMVEGDEQSRVDIDLSSQNGYQNGVSRRHAIIHRRKDLLYIEDLKSTNGTRINGAQLTPGREYLLRDGDIVEFGRMRVALRFLNSTPLTPNPETE